MREFGITLKTAKRLQEWAIKSSNAKKVLDKIPLFGVNTKKDGIYVDYTIDKKELCSGPDYPDVGVVTIYGIKNMKKMFLGEIRAYNFETYWLCTKEYDEVDTIEDWYELIRRDFANSED